MFQRAAPIVRNGWPYAALLAGVFVAALIAGYVYAHEPARDQVALRVDSTPPAEEHIVSGTVIEVSDGRLLLDSDGQRVEITLASGVLVEELQRSGGPFASGTVVNVGAEHTGFGLVLTGIVAVEGAGP